MPEPPSIKRAWCDRCECWGGAKSHLGNWLTCLSCGKRITGHKPVDIDKHTADASVAEARKARARS